MTISDILEKAGIKSIDDLKPAEKATYAQWQAILSKQPISIEDLKTLLPKELDRANIELRKHENSPDKDSFYKAYTTLCDFIIRAISAPDKEREQLKAMLKQKYNLD